MHVQIRTLTRQWLKLVFEGATSCHVANKHVKNRRLYNLANGRRNQSFAQVGARKQKLGQCLTLFYDNCTLVHVRVLKRVLFNTQIIVGPFLSDCCQ